MRQKTLLYFTLGFLFCTKSIQAQESANCKLVTIQDQRDFSENIPGETMGQKLESLLFWTQEERARRFAIMQSIYPSIAVEAAKNPKALAKGKNIKKSLAKYQDVEKYLADNYVNSLIVLKEGKIRLEAYADNANKEQLWTSFSVAKSISSMLLGIALKEGYIKSMEDKLEEYIPEFKAKDYGKVTVRQLLTMTSGIDWNEDYTDKNSDVAQMYLKECQDTEAHIITYMKDLKSLYPNGEKWNYSTGETDLVGILIQKATGKSLADYLSEKIWKPYGMENCAYWLADECSNLNIGGSGLSASIRDFARLGQFMLDSGKINDHSIFAKEWIENAAAPLYQINEDGGAYGYLWWRNPDGSFVAQGIFGQLIYINPKKQIVFAQNAAWPHASSKELNKKRKEFIQAIERVL